MKTGNRLKNWKILAAGLVFMTTASAVTAPVAASSLLSVTGESQIRPIEDGAGKYILKSDGFYCLKEDGSKDISPAVHYFDHVNIDKSRTYVPNGLEEDSEKACADYNEIIRNVGGVDMQLLGIGGNGHIGFNEPGEAFEKETHCVDLTESTIKVNARFFASMDEVPKQAYTMGIKNIMAAKKILLVATGSAKADALYKSLYGPITPNVPASILQLHSDVTVVADEEALSIIREKGLL